MAQAKNKRKTQTEKTPKKEAISLTSAKNIGLVSIVTPVYNTNAQYLSEAYESVLRQTHKNWEWCICDDGTTDAGTLRVLEDITRHARTRIIRLDKNSGICEASIVAAQQAVGEIITFLDHDDLLHVEALQEIMTFFNMHDADAVYTDEAIWRTDSAITQIHTKPNFSPHYLRSVNYICHLFAIRRDLYTSIGGLRAGFDGSQDHDLALRLASVTKKIFHIAKCLYYWRMHAKSYSKTKTLSVAVKNGVKAIKQDLERNNTPGTVTAIADKTNYNVKLAVKNNPVVDIVIPTFRTTQTLAPCLEKLIDITSYNNYRINLVTDSMESTSRQMSELSERTHKKINILLEYDNPINMPKILNAAMKKVKGDYAVVMHDDVYIETEDWLEWFIGYAQGSGVGAVSGKIHNKENNIMEFGGILTQTGITTSLFQDLPIDAPGDFGRAQLIQNTTAVFCTLMMVSTEKFNAVSGFDERYTLNHFDVDFCLKLKHQGYANVIIPQCKALHLKSDRKFFSYTKNVVNGIIHADKSLFVARHGLTDNQADPYSNPIFAEKKDRLNTIEIEKLSTIKNNAAVVPAIKDSIINISVIKKLNVAPTPAPPVVHMSPPKTPHFFLENPHVLVSYIVPWYDQIPIAVFSLLTQTYTNIEIILYHDGPLTKTAKSFLPVLTDKRIKLFYTKKRYDDWGHTPRSEAIDQISSESAAVVFTGADNYYLPIFTIELFSLLCQNSRIVATYCDMAHSHKNWKSINTDLRYAYIDCGCFMVRPEVVKEFGWGTKVSWEDWVFIEKVINKYTEDAITKTPKVLYIHN